MLRQVIIYGLYVYPPQFVYLRPTLSVWKVYAEKEAYKQTGTYAYRYNSKNS